MYTHNYDERGTFKIYHSFVFGQANFQTSEGHSDASIKIAIFKKAIPKCDLKGRIVMVDCSSSLPVRLYSGIDTFCLP